MIYDIFDIFELTVVGVEHPDVAVTFIAVVYWVAAVQPAPVAVPIWTVSRQQVTSHQSHYQHKNITVVPRGVAGTLSFMRTHTP